MNRRLEKKPILGSATLKLLDALQLATRLVDIHPGLFMTRGDAQHLFPDLDRFGIATAGVKIDAQQVEPLLVTGFDIALFQRGDQFQTGFCFGLVGVDGKGMFEGLPGLLQFAGFEGFV